MALNTSSEGELPTEIELIPAGRTIVGVDGRTWINDNPDAIVSAFKARNTEMVVDFFHAVETPQIEAPAAGWINRLEVREGGSIWGRVEWTPKGKDVLRGKEYRYISPVFWADNNKRILRMSSATMTNKPNLPMKALNQAGAVTQSENGMLPKQLCHALGVPEAATEAEAVNAVSALKESKSKAELALNQVQTPDLTQFVPMESHKKLEARALSAEKALNQEQAAKHTTAIETELDTAAKEGKIAPASRPMYLAMCQQQGGLEKFRELAKTLPVIVPASGLDGKHPEGATLALNQAESEVAAKLGLTKEKYLAAKNTNNQHTQQGA